MKSEILNTTRFDENSDLGMAYLGKTNIIRDHKMIAEEKFSMSEQGYTIGKLLDGTEYQILLDTGASKSFMSKSHYFALPISSFITQICVKSTKNSSR